MSRSFPWLLAIALVVASAQSAAAQNLLGGGGLDIFDPTEVKVSIIPTSAKRGDTVTVSVTFVIPEDSHTYPVNKMVKAGGSTTIELGMTGLTSVDKTFTPDRKPKLKVDPVLKETVEVFTAKVTWTRKYRVNDDAPAQIKIAGDFNGLVCDKETCRPFEQKFNLKLDVLGPKPKSKPATPVVHVVKHPERGPLDLVSEKSPAHWTLTLSPKDAKPGDKVTVSLNAILAAGYHTFAVDHLRENIGIPTTTTFNNLTGLKPVSEDDQFTTADQVDLHLEDGKEQRLHHNMVTWTREFIVEPTAEETGYGLSGKVRFQVCTASSCRPGRFEFVLGSVDPNQNIVEPTAQGNGDSQSDDASKSNAIEAAAFFGDLQVRKSEDEGDDDLLSYLLYAFLGGLILNVMPCVLPVIAIKALSFAQQAGEDRRRIFSLNMTYSAGVVCVFLILATLAWLSGFGWGGLFQHAYFTVTMAAVVFAMGLSLLGVFEIPIPGFVGSAAGHQREGLPGAFLTGVFATILATPCSGPFLGTALAWSVKQEPVVIYAVWAMMGIGMAFPYMLFAAFPGFVKFLPKPGNWMIRLKEFAGLVLMGTTIFLLSSLTEQYMIPTLITLLGVGTAVWMLGNLADLMSSRKRRWIVRLSALSVFCLSGWIGYTMQAAPDEKTSIAWETFDVDRIVAALDDDKTVMVDFTASWCLTCHALEASTLNTQKTVDALNEKGIVAMKADWSDGDATVTAALTGLNMNAIPTLAIFSPARPKEPIVLHGLWTQAQLLKHLEDLSSESAETQASLDRDRQ